jgi:hypothetical protein
MSIKGFDWLKRIVLPVGLAMMDLCWIYPWSLLIGIWLRPDASAPLLSAASILVLLIAGRAVTRFALGRPWPVRPTRIGVVALGLVVVLVAIRLDQYGQVGLTDFTWFLDLGSAFASVFSRLSAPVPASALGLFLWWRAISLARGRLYFEDVERSFGIGLAALVTCLLVTATTGSSVSNSLKAGAGLCVVGFFLTGLASLSLARLETLREQGRVRGERPLAFNRQWLVVMVGIVLAMLLLTLGLAQFLSFDLIATVAGPLLDVLANVAWFLLYIIAWPLGLLAAVVVYLARWILHPSKPPPSPEPPDTGFLDDLRKQGPPTTLPPELILALKWAIIGLVACVVILILVRAVFKWREWERDDEVVEERDSVWNWGLVKEALLAWLHSLRQRLRRRPPAAVADSAQSSGQAVEEPAAVLTIREIYRRLLALGASVGLTRASHTTPYEHLPRLQSRLKPEEDLAAITETYVKARYGPELPSQIEVDHARIRWEHVLIATREPGLDATLLPDTVGGNAATQEGTSLTRSSGLRREESENE